MFCSAVSTLPASVVLISLIAVVFASSLPFVVFSSVITPVSTRSLRAVSLSVSVEFIVEILSVRSESLPVISVDRTSILSPFCLMFTASSSPLSLIADTMPIASSLISFFSNLKPFASSSIISSSFPDNVLVWNFIFLAMPSSCRLTSEMPPSIASVRALKRFFRVDVWSPMAATISEAASSIAVDMTLPLLSIATFSTCP